MAEESGNKSGQDGGKGALLATLVACLVGIAAGAALGVFLPVESTPATRKEATPHGKGGEASAKDGGHGEKKAAVSTVSDQVVQITPIIVNVMGKPGQWMRVEGAVTFRELPKDDKALLMAQLAEDMAGILRSTPAFQLATPSGLEYLRDDLSEIVRLRSGNRARRFILTSLVIE